MSLHQLHSISTGLGSCDVWGVLDVLVSILLHTLLRFLLDLVWGNWFCGSHSLCKGLGEMHGIPGGSSTVLGVPIGRIRMIGPFLF